MHCNIHLIQIQIQHIIQLKCGYFAFPSQLFLEFRLHKLFLWTSRISKNGLLPRKGEGREVGRAGDFWKVHRNGNWKEIEVGCQAAEDMKWIWTGNYRITQKDNEKEGRDMISYCKGMITLKFWNEIWIVEYRILSIFYDLKTL